MSAPLRDTVSCSGADPRTSAVNLCRMWPWVSKNLLSAPGNISSLSFSHLSVKYTGLSPWYYRWQKPEVVRPADFRRIVIDSRGCPLSSLDLNTDLSGDVWKVCICINQSNIRLMEHLRSAVDQLVILVYRIGIWCEYHAKDCLGSWILNCGGGLVSSWELFTIG